MSYHYELSYRWFDDGIIGEVSFKCKCGKTIKRDLIDMDREEEYAIVECSDCHRKYKFNYKIIIEELK